MKIFNREKARERKLTDEYAKYLQNLIRKAGSVDKNYTVFGSSKHKYCLNPVATQEQIQQFEEKYHLKLPEEYVFYMTKVSNGGPGPYYGLYTLEEMMIHNSETPYYGSIYEQTVTPDMPRDKWEELMRKYEDIPDEEYDEFMGKLTANMLVIGTQGCTYDHIIMLTGKDANKVMRFDWNMEEEGPPRNIGMHFLEWMELYFQEIIDEHNLTSYGYRLIRTQDQVRKEYSNELEFQEKKQLIAALYRYKSLDTKSVQFLKEIAIKDEEIAFICVSMLLSLEPKAGLTLLDEFIAQNKVEIVCQCVSSIPKDKKESYYEKLLPILYQVKTKMGKSILFFVSDCEQLRAKDLIDFTEQIEEKELLKTAIYVLGKCPDALDYVDSFIKWMKSEEYWIAHTALQAMANRKHEKLGDVYDWMEEKYKKDSTMRSNLKFARKTLQEEK